MQRIDAGGHELLVDVSGQKSPVPAFLCLHGLADNMKIWSSLSRLLARRGRVVRIDLRGHGGSDAPPGPYSRDMLAADAVAVLDALEIERVILVGHSLGGMVAIVTALAAPERVAGLVVLGTAPHCSERAAEWYERIAHAAEERGIDGFTRAIYGNESPKHIEGDAPGMAAVTRTLQSLYRDPLTPKLGGLHCPLLAIVGDKDPLGPQASEAIAEHAPEATLEVIFGAGHWTHVEAPDEVIAAIDRWMKRHTLSA